MAEESEVMNENNEVKCLQRNLESYREAVIFANSVLVWEKPFYPGILSGALTFILLCIWWFDFTVLTTLSCLGLLLCIFDYLIPVLTASLCTSDSWTGSKERQFESVCSDIVNLKCFLMAAYDKLGHWKEKRPKTYFFGVVCSLLILAWIGNNISNIFFTYIFCLAMLMMPGLRKHGLIEKYSAHLILFFSNLIGQKLKQK